MSLSRYCGAPCVGHLEVAKQMVAYLVKSPRGALRFHTGIPDHEAIMGRLLSSLIGCILFTIYPQEPMSVKMPAPKGKCVRTTTFVDANLMHDFSTRRSATGNIHMLN